jgi:hypothetical protein
MNILFEVIKIKLSVRTTSIMNVATTLLDPSGTLANSRPTMASVYEESHDPKNVSFLSITIKILESMFAKIVLLEKYNHLLIEISNEIVDDVAVEVLLIL